MTEQSPPSEPPKPKGKVGGARPGAGRKHGSKNVRKAKYAETALAEGITPIDVMIRTMRGLWDKATGPNGAIRDMEMAERACGVAKDAAPFCHPRLNSVDMSAELNVRNLSDDALNARIEELEAEIRAAAAARGEG